MRKTCYFGFLWGWMFVVCGVSFAAAEPQKYESDFNTVMRLAEDLYRALPKEKRATMLPRPVLLDKFKTPYLQPGTQPKDNTNWQAVYVSPPLIDVLNYVSHAKAVDNVDSGFFAKAINSLASENGNALAALYQPTHKKSWAFNTMNWQLSHFNQMAAGLIAI